MYYNVGFKFFCIGGQFMCLFSMGMGKQLFSNFICSRQLYIFKKRKIVHLYIEPGDKYSQACPYSHLY